MPEAAEPKKKQDGIQANKDADRIVSGQKSVREIKNGKLSTKKDKDEALAKLEKLAKANPGTIVEKQAKDLLEKLTAGEHASK